MAQIAITDAKTAVNTSETANSRVSSKCSVSTGSAAMAIKLVAEICSHASGNSLSGVDQRLINTSAVRCVGNTLILQGRVYSPPFIVTGVGDQAAMERELERDDYLRGFQAAVEFFGLGYEQVREESVTLPGFEGPLGIEDATVIPDKSDQKDKK